MPPSRFILPGASELKPLRQGSLSGMCGLYSALNATQLAVYPVRLSRAQLQDFYRHGVAHLARHRQLRRVLGVGMPERTWLQLAGAIAIRANQETGSSLVVQPLLRGSTTESLPRALRAIRKSVARGNPVMTGLGSTLDHYTVIAGFTHQRLLLFDSSGFRWVYVASLGVGAESSARHVLYTSSVSAIVDDW